MRNDLKERSVAVRQLLLQEARPDNQVDAQPVDEPHGPTPSPLETTDNAGYT